MGNSWSCPHCSTVFHLQEVENESKRGNQESSSEVFKKKGNRSSSLTKNFTLKEFACKCGAAVPDKYYNNVKTLAENLQVLRDHFNGARRIKVNSGYRTPDYNKRVGGSPKSQHLLAKAADIEIDGYTTKEVAEIIEMLIQEGKMKQGGIGIYNTFVHYDIRGKRARWDLRK